MNRSCNSILCRFGIHTADPYVHIQVKCRNGSHRWQSNYEICKRCRQTPKKNPHCKGASVMKITLDIPDGIIAGFFNGVEVTAHGMQLVSYQLSTDDLKDGNTVKLPREQEVTV